MSPHAGCRPCRCAAGLLDLQTVSDYDDAIRLDAGDDPGLQDGNLLRGLDDRQCRQRPGFVMATGLTGAQVSTCG